MKDVLKVATRIMSFNPVTILSIFVITKTTHNSFYNTWVDLMDIYDRFYDKLFEKLNLFRRRNHYGKI